MDISRNIITSRHNPAIKKVVQLKERKYRERLGEFVIEGQKELQEALKAKVPLTEVLFCRELMGDFTGQEFLKTILSQKIQAQEVSKEVFLKMSYREGPDGLIGVAKQWKLDLAAIKLSKNPLLVICERIEKPGNLGALIRSVEAVGADGLLICDPVIDIFNANVIRASRGMLFSIQIAVTTNEDAYSFLKKHAVKMIVTTPQAEKLYWDEGMKGVVGIVIGSEHEGLTPFWLEKKDVAKVKIPLVGDVDSLNAGVAGVLILYEVLRQRTRHCGGG